jgi:hypothetical protein
MNKSFLPGAKWRQPQRAYSIARRKSTEIQSIYRIDQEMLWRLVSERQMMSAIYSVAG